MRLLLRIGLVLTALGEGIPTLWAAVSPLSFQLGFPTPELAWLTEFPPYNEHMTRDFGLIGLQFAVILGYAAVSMRHALVRAVLAASLVFNVPHLIYHQHHGATGNAVPLQVISQAAPIALAVLLLVVNELANRPAPAADRQEQVSRESS
ncbi:hypothetical protein OU415_04225 [Saccharopolyspora sp. WRP15-2]|uniref:DoxX-like protein n=1 Tax=Saccharopolyspora oryzae TaxID=2997343 RepID=A0ABT4USY0_9PSEU|nr:hypothetical protein [Saccharopolyspora oryzae]MDA3624633.1 hypothetical protein [Saccharopolyspora oryzae]